MSDSVAILRQALVDKQFVEVRTLVNTDDETNAFVVGLSEELVILNHIDGSNTMILNGYTLLPLREIHSACYQIKNLRFYDRALAVLGIQPVLQPDISLTDMVSFFSSVESRFPLLSLFREHKKPDTCLVGQVRRVKEDAVHLRLIDTKARWMRRIEKLPYSHITRVEFGGGYEMALWTVAEAERQAKRLLDDL